MKAFDGYVLGGDLGSGSCKVAALGGDGRIIGEATQSYDASYPQPGWVEQDPELWYRAFRDAVGNLIRGLPRDAGPPKALALVGVTHNAVLLDKAGKALAPSILIFDTRSLDQTAEIKRIFGENRVRTRTGNDVTAQWTWPQLLWVRDHNPEILKKTHRLLFMKDYVRNRLVDSPVTDFIDAQGSLLFDPFTGEWIDEYIQRSGLRTGWFPEVVSPMEIVGRIGPAASLDTGIPEGTPVIAGTTDTAAETLGCGANRPEMGYVKLASVGRIAVTAARPIEAPRVLNYSHVLEGLWYPGTATKAAASAYRWWRDCAPAGGAVDYRRMDRDAADIPPGSGGVLFLPHLHGQWAPLWDDEARGAFVGLSAGHGYGHLTRAVLEGVAFSIKDALEELESLGAVFRRISLLGGGAKSDLWAGIVADIIDRTVVTPNYPDASYGACLIAAMGAGFLDATAEAMDREIHTGEPRDPKPENVRIYRDLFDRYRNTNERLFSRRNQ